MSVPLDRRRRWAAWHEAGHVLGFVRAGILPAARLYGDGGGVAYPARIVEPDAAVMRRARRYEPPAWTADGVRDPTRAQAILRDEAIVTLAGPLATRTLCRFPPPVGSDDAEFRLVAAMLRPLEAALGRPWPVLFTDLRRRTRRLLEEHRSFVAAVARRLHRLGRIEGEEVSSLFTRWRRRGSSWTSRERGRHARASSLAGGCEKGGAAQEGSP